MSWHLELDASGKTMSAIGSTYPVKEMLKAHGFRWNPEARKWAGAPLSACAPLWQYAKDPDLRARLQAMQSVRAQSLDASRAADAKIDLPCPDGQAYMPFQRAGVAYALHREGTLIADEMGLGKTVQGCGLINAIDARRILIVCPASLRLVWKRHAQSWLVRRLPIFMANGRKDRQFAHAVESSTDGVFIINYDVLIGYVGVQKHETSGRWDRKGASGPLVRAKWDVVIGDEIHLIKNYKAQRSVAFTCLQGMRRVGLTGTPIVNRSDELGPIVGWVDPGIWTYKALQEYAGAGDCRVNRLHPCGTCRSCRQAHLLQTKLRETIMVRRLKRDVLTELPAKRRQVVELEATGEAASLVARQMLKWQSHAAAMQAAENAAKAAQEANDEAAYRAAVAKMNGGYKVAFEEMSIERRELAQAKIPYAIEHVDGMRESGINKIIVFAHHHEVIDRLREHYGKACVVVDGRVSKDARQACVDRFQNDDTCEIFIGGIIPAGVGLTLTAASHVVFVELDWVPGNMTQAEDRAHRIGQANSVLVQHLVFADSLDARMAHTLVGKQAAIEQALDKGTLTPSPAVEAPPAVAVAEPVAVSVPAQSEDDYAAVLPF